MSDVEFPKYVAGAPWNALVTLGTGQEPKILRLWGVDAVGAPFFADAMTALGVSLEGVVPVWSLDPDGLRAETFAQDEQRAAVASLLREQIPGINFEPDADWDFSADGAHHDSV